MGRKSSIDLLPDELRQELLSLLSKPEVTQQEITKLINEKAGQNVVSKSAVNRYSMKMEEFAKKNREARAVAEMLGKQMNNGQSNLLGKVAIEQARIIIFELFTAIDEIKKTPENPKEVINLSNSVFRLVKAVNELEQASETNIALEEKIKAKAEQTAEEVSKTIRSEGLSETTVEAIKQKILGIA